MNNTVPAACKDCTEKDCFECDNAGQRWPLSKREELQAKLKLAEQGIARLQEQKRMIEKELKQLPKE